MKTYAVLIPHEEYGQINAIIETSYQITKHTMFNQILKEYWDAIHEPFALEFMIHQQNITLCITASDQALDLIMGSLYANFAHIQIEPYPSLQEDIPGNWNVASADLKFLREDIIPLRDYSVCYVDSLAPPFNAFQCLPPEGKYVMQFVLKPVPDSTRLHMSLKAALFKERFRHMFRPKYWLKKHGTAKRFKGIAEKYVAELFHVSARCGVALPPDYSDERDVPHLLNQMFRGYTETYSADGNRFFLAKPLYGEPARERLEKRVHLKPFKLSTKEIATLWHIVPPGPGAPVTKLMSKRFTPPTNLPSLHTDPDLGLFGVNSYRGNERLFGILPEDRLRHMYVIGKTGSGKSKLLELLIRDDIEQGRGAAVIDPHGDLVDAVVRSIPQERISDVVLFDPCDKQFPVSFNPFSAVPAEHREVVAQDLFQAFLSTKITCPSEETERLLLRAIETVIGIPGSTVRTILRLLRDESFRRDVVFSLDNPALGTFWSEDFLDIPVSERDVLLASLENRIGQLLATDLIHHVMDAPINKVNLVEIMQRKKILLIRLPKGILGARNARFLASLLLARIRHAAGRSYRNVADGGHSFSLYIDEFHCMTSKLMMSVFQQATQSGLAVTIANQCLSQLTEDVRKELLQNVGSFLSFQLSGHEAELVSERFPSTDLMDLMNLSLREFFVQMTVKGEKTPTFTGKTIDVTYGEDFTEQIRHYSREHYAVPLGDAQDIAELWSRAA
ncbi:MAG: DUF87 domain-containing protein [Bdellovibrionales bacterium]|nr:DUF87 domain-containing protein [Bdellovibrionales bacterium]